MNAAQNTLARNISARASAQTALNSVTAIGSRLAGGMLQLIGGWPGALLLAGGSWYAMYQNQEQARRSAQEYANTIDEIRQRSGAMSLTETAENYDKTKSSLSEQNRLIEEQKEKIRLIKVEIAGYQQMLASPGLTISGYMINHLMSVEEATNGLSTATDSLSVEQDRLSRLQGKAQDIQTVLAGLEHRRVVLIRQQAAEQNAAYQSLLRMNGQHTEFNRLLSLGNDLLSARQNNVAAPLRLPNATLSDKQKEAIEKSHQDLELSKLKGEAKELKRLGYSADDLGLTNSPSNQTARQDYINNNLSVWRNDEANKPKPKGAKTDEEKAVDTYDRLIKQQREQLALGSQNTELAKVKYQISQGELSALSDAQKQELLRSATALDHLKTQERFKELQNELLTPEEELLKKTRERIELLKQAAPATEAPKFGGIDASVGGASGELIRVAEAQKQLEEWYKKQLEMQQELLQTQEGYEQEYANRIVEIQATKAQRMQDIQAGYTSASLSMFSDLASQGASLLQTMGEQGSAAYKALFIASKAAAIAQAIINTELAATKAMAEGGMMFGIPAASMIRGVGYASVSLIAAQTLAGMAHDGIDNVPREGTWLLDRGERVVDARTNADLKNYLSTKNVGGVSDEQISAISNNRSNITIAQTIQVSGNGDRALTAAMGRAANQGAQQGAALARQQLLQDFQSRGQARRLLGV